MKYILVACFLSLVVSYVTSQTSARPKSSNSTSGPVQTMLTNEEITTLLDSHNSARILERAENMPNLTWNSILASKAQNWTDACNFRNQPVGIRKWGENMAAMSNTRSRPEILVAMVKQWVEEKRHNIAGTFEECCSFNANSCCHYTQVIWGATTSVGCGFSVCQDLIYGTGSLHNIAFMACYYNPPGNIPKVTYNWSPYTPAAIATKQGSSPASTSVKQG